MELPFAVDASLSATAADGNDSSSLMTASSQGSLVPADDGQLPLHLQQQQQQQQSVFTTTCEPISPPTTISRREPEPQQQQTTMRSVLPEPPPLGTNTSTTSMGVDVLKSAGSRVSSVLSHFGYNRSSQQNNNNIAQNRPQHQQQPHHPPTTVSQNPRGLTVGGDGTTTTTIIEHPDTEAIDFAYINVTDEDEVDIWLDDDNTPYQYSKHNPDSVAAAGDSTLDTTYRRADILTVLIAATADSTTHDDDASSLSAEQLIAWTEQANDAAARAVTAKKEGNVQEALDRHTAAAKLFHEAAVLVREHDASMANTLLLLSQTQAKSALALKRIVKLRPNALSTFQNNNRLRATVRGALNSKREADISDSAFLGKATKPPAGATPELSTDLDSTAADNSSNLQACVSSENPVDEMMELERELRDMDMTLVNSIASLGARTQNRMKSSVSESFMVVPAGSYMSSSSSIILGPAGRGPNPTSNVVAVGGGTAGVRARANRVQSLGRPAHPLPPAPQSVPQAKFNSPQPPQSLESSWWGNASMASQVLTSSVISLASVGPGQQQQQQQPANTKQLMRLMDSLRTLGDENAALLREVEDAEAARMEAKAAREQMKRFKEEYGKRFAALKEALEKFRKGYPGDSTASGELNPVTSSEFSRSASTSDQLQRQEQLIRKLTADLKKEKEEGKKKDGALRKYESFYREVKARSAQKAAQRQQQQK